MALPQAQSRAEYARWFREADKNNNGFLTTKELKKMFKNKGYKTTGKQFKITFANLDKDGDKKVTLDEYLLGMGQIPDIEHKEVEIRLAFERADVNKDGKLDLDEMKMALRDITTGMTNKELFDIMRKADNDHSGNVDYNEFTMIFLKQKGYFD